MDHPRQSVFVGTTNEDTYFDDPTGARRFWPLRCREILIPELTTDRDQLFAEAAQLYRDDNPWWDTPLDETMAQQEGRRKEDPWEDAVRNYVRGKSEARVPDILEAINVKLSDQNTYHGIRVGDVLRALGWEKHVFRRDGRQQKIWTPK